MNAINYIIDKSAEHQSNFVAWSSWKHNDLDKIQTHATKPNGSVVTNYLNEGEKRFVSWRS